MAKAPKRKKVTVWLSTSVHAQLKKESKERHVDQGYIIEEALHARPVMTSREYMGGLSVDAGTFTSGGDNR